jgi:predicted DNA-binding transcriptional regulator YafY
MAHPRGQVISISEARKRREAKAEEPVTKAEIAAHFGVTPRTISRWMVELGMPHYKPYEHGALRFYVSACDDWFRDLSQRRAAP